MFATQAISRRNYPKCLRFNLLLVTMLQEHGRDCRSLQFQTWSRSTVNDYLSSANLKAESCKEDKEIERRWIGLVVSLSPPFAKSPVPE